MLGTTPRTHRARRAVGGHSQERSRPPLTVKSEVSTLPKVGPFSTMKLRSPVRMVDTDQAGFHVSGWKSVMERHSLHGGAASAEAHIPTTTAQPQPAVPYLVLHLNLPLGVIM